MSALVRLRAIAYGYQVELGGRVLGAVKRIRMEDGQAWSSVASIRGHAPLPGFAQELHTAARKILLFARGR